jgi:hypothetical protein
MSQSNVTAEYSKMLCEDARLLREQSRNIVGDAKKALARSRRRLSSINARRRKLKLK